MNLALFDFDGTITSSDTWTPFMRLAVRRIRQRYQLARYGVVYAYGDSAEDREMLELAHEKFYRWRREIAGWHEVTSFGHPDQGGRHS